MYGPALALLGALLVILGQTSSLNQLYTVNRQQYLSTYGGSQSVRPPNKEQLGRGGWTIIHTMAANYPQSPTDDEKVHATAFFRSIGALYPCKLCRDHFDRFIAVQPPDVSSREKLLLWTCVAHNEVNTRNGKRTFPCSVKELDKRWGDCGCNS